MPDDTHRAIETVWRIEAPRLIAGLTRLVRDVGVAEELAQDALVAALEQWPADGVPGNPGAWLMTIAKRRAVDRIRRDATYRRKLAEVGRETPEATPDVAEDDGFGDDLLRLVFVACHPVLSREARVALTLRLLGSLTTDEIARAFLVPEPTVAQRIVRAKKTLAKAGVPFEVPQGEELAVRLSSVLEVVYLIFNEGYAATAGDDWMRPELCAEALRLGRVLARLAPREPEVHGLVALMEIQASRAAARTGPGGEPILLADQNRARWDRLLIGRGLAALDRAEALAGGRPGPYVLQAAIRRRARPGPPVRGHRLGTHRRALRAAGRDGAVPGGRTEPGGGAVHGVRPGGRAGPAGPVDRRRVPAGLPPAARGARRPPGQAGPARRGTGRVRTGGVADPQRARPHPAAGPRRGAGHTSIEGRTGESFNLGSTVPGVPEGGYACVGER